MMLTPSSLIAPSATLIAVIVIATDIDWNLPGQRQYPTDLGYFSANPKIELDPPVLILRLT